MSMRLLLLFGQKERSLSFIYTLNIGAGKSWQTGGPYQSVAFNINPDQIHMREKKYCNNSKYRDRQA